MTIPEKITFRTGTLASAIGNQIELTGETPSDYIRRLIAEDCKVTPPEMKSGNPEPEKAAAARWGKHKAD